MTPASQSKRLSRLTARMCLISLLFALMPLTANAQTTNTSKSVPAFTDTQIKAILQHGPWPALPWPASGHPDPTNSLSGNADAAALGRLLFFDARLSPSGRVSCSSCHRPEKSYADAPRALSLGIATSRRNTQSLQNVRHFNAFGWTGSNASLWMQSIRPILDPREMGSSAEHVRDHIAKNPQLARSYRDLTGTDPATADAQSVLIGAAKALAAFQETIASPPTPFDAFRDALASPDTTAAARYPTAARRGALNFTGPAGCSNCHLGPAFSDSRVHHIGTASAPAFRTPALRNLTHTAPYLHDGSAPTLAAAIRAHKNGPRLDKAQTADLVAFLKTLSAP